MGGCNIEGRVSVCEDNHVSDGSGQAGQGAGGRRGDIQLGSCNAPAGNGASGKTW